MSSLHTLSDNNLSGAYKSVHVKKNVMMKSNLNLIAFGLTLGLVGAAALVLLQRVCVVCSAVLALHVVVQQEASQQGFHAVHLPS